MKRILLALAIVALVLPATRSAKAADVSVDFFYNNLNTGGSWVDAGDYGYAWQPEIAVSNRNWRPYTDGNWAYTDVGWTWVSNEDFGWATYHYGRWARVRGRGWVWVPGREWGPAWVSWRTGGDHVGWAPLPPRRGSRRGEVVYEGRPINGYVDIDFDIGPAYYNFVDIRYIGGSGLRQRILPYDQNVGYVERSVNVTNITYNNDRVYNYGPDYNRMSAYSTQPIQRLTLQRDSSANLNAAVQSGAVTRVQGNTLMVAAPQRFEAAPQNAAPKEVKTKIAQSDLETGWSGITDEKQKAQLQAQMKKEDRKSIPPPDMKPQNPEALTAASPAPAEATSPATSPENPAASPAATIAASPAKNGKDKDGAAGDVTPAPTATAAASPEATATASPDGKDEGKGKDRGKATPAATVAPAAESTPASDAAAPKADPKKGQSKKSTETPVATPSESAAASDNGTEEKSARKDRKGRDKKAESAAPVATSEVTTEAKEPAEVAPRKERAGKKNKLPDMQTSERPLKEAAPETQQVPDRIESPASAPAADAGDSSRGRGNKRQKAERQSAEPAAEAPAPQREPAAPPQAAPESQPERAPAAQADRPKKEKREKKEKQSADEPAPEPEG